MTGELAVARIEIEPTVSSEPRTIPAPHGFVTEPAGDGLPSIRLRSCEEAEEARATAEAEIERLRRQRAQWLRLHTAEIDRLREAIPHLAGMVLGDAGTEYAEAVLAEYDATTPASSRFLDLDAPDAGQRMATALRQTGISVAYDHEAMDEFAPLILAALKEDRREPGGPTA